MQAMTVSLLDQFLAWECTPFVRHLLDEAIADASPPRPHFEFNRFEVTIERANSMVVLEDVLDATEAGTQRVPLAEFANALSRCSAR
jgi:hypothetical protein